MKYCIFFGIALVTASLTGYANEKSEFQLAIERNDVDEVTKQISGGEDVNQKFGMFKVPAIGATLGFSERIDVLKVLLQKGANVDAVDRDNSTALIKAAQFNSADSVRVLIAHGANVNHVNNDGYFPLAAAVASGKPEKVQLLLENGADIELTGGKKGFGYTALIHAVVANKLELTKLLVKHGANVNHKSIDGSAVELAKQLKNKEILAVLEEIN